MSEVTDLFPETLGESAPVLYESADALDKWGYARVVVRLIPKWSEATGLWTVGWFCRVDRAVDEWVPGASIAANWPWYRTDHQPTSRHFAIACAIAARAVKIVIEQMLAHVGPDIAGPARDIEGLLETQVRCWLCGVDNNS